MLTSLLQYFVANAPELPNLFFLVFVPFLVWRFHVLPPQTCAAGTDVAAFTKKARLSSSLLHAIYGCDSCPLRCAALVAVCMFAAGLSRAVCGVPACRIYYAMRWLHTAKAASHACRDVARCTAARLNLRGDTCRSAKYSLYIAYGFRCRMSVCLS